MSYTHLRGDREQRHNHRDWKEWGFRKGAGRTKPLGHSCGPSYTGEHCLCQGCPHRGLCIPGAGHLDQAGYCSVVSTVPSATGRGGDCVCVGWECAISCSLSQSQRGYAWGFLLFFFMGAVRGEGFITPSHWLCSSHVSLGDTQKAQPQPG